MKPGGLEEGEAGGVLLVAVSGVVLVLTALQGGGQLLVETHWHLVHHDSSGFHQAMVFECLPD